MARQTAPAGARFTQIAVGSAFDSSNEETVDSIYGLDAEGNVWSYNGDGWEPLNMERLPADEGGEEDV